jgi:hypothetical protein
MPNEKLVSIRGKENLMKSETYRLYYEQKEQILNQYPPLKLRTREEHLECIRKLTDLMWEVGGYFQQFIWENMSEIDQINQDRRADARKPGGKKPGPKPSYENIDE